MNLKTRNIISWLLIILLAITFIMAGFAKISAQEEMVVSFDNWGLPTFTMYIIGIAELFFGISLFFKKTRPFSIITLLLIMIGAIGTHLLNGETFLPPLFLLLLLISLFFVNKK